jgi:hypothetical protein
MPAANGFNAGDGLNTGSYSFSSPNPKTRNTTIVRLDYTPSSKHHIFGRGNLQKDTTAGVGIYYDHFGQSLISIFDQQGSFGLSSQVSNPAGQATLETSPRFTDRHTLPFNNGVPPTTQNFPYLAPQGNFAITWGLDSRMKTPYSEAFDLSVQRELPGGFTLEAAYVGRLGRHLLQSLDLAEPVNFVDPAGRRRLLLRRVPAISTSRPKWRQCKRSRSFDSIL